MWRQDLAPDYWREPLNRIGTAKKVFITLLVFGAVTSVIGMGSFASFTATTSNPGNTFSTGTLAMDTNHSGTSFVTLSGMVPGDSVTGLLNVQSTGTQDMTYVLTTTATTSSVLDTDATDGLKLWVQRCSVAWTGSGPGATCSGTSADVVGTTGAPVAIIGSALAMGNLCDTDADSVRAARGN